MLKGQTTIGRFAARCPAGTEPLVARMRLARLFGGADLAPPGFPPRAVLVIRRVRAGRGVTLGARLLRPESEREMREQVSALWRRAARPVRGRAPAWAEAVLFEDEGEWLASLGIAVLGGESAGHWCWRASVGVEWTAAPRRTLVRAWADSPRFIPAALVRLARWGEAARFLGALAPAESGALLHALGSEFDLPRAARPTPTRAADAAPARDATSETRHHDAASLAKSDYGRNATRSLDGQDSGRDARRDGLDGREQFFEEAMTPPWRRWLPSAGVECERLPPAAQRLLAYAAALFHAPALARGRDFAEEVHAFTVEGAARRRRAPEPTRDDTQRALPRARGDEELDAGSTPFASDYDASTHAHGVRPPDVKPEPDATAHTHLKDGLESIAPASKRPATRVDVAARTADETSEVSAVDDEPHADARVAPWTNLEGCETRLGGALFLLNLLRGLQLPECFDEDYSLSEHVTGWGLTELLARSLLGGLCAKFDDDPLWGALAHLDGRAAGEPPAQGLRAGNTYRAPARWLKLFAPREDEDAWVFAEDGIQLTLRHAAGFDVAALPLGGVAPHELAARLADEYRAQGVCAPPTLKHERRERGGGPTVREDARLPSRRMRRKTDALAHGRASASSPYGEEVRRWMGWTFPFMAYALRRSAAGEGEAAADDEAVRELLVRRGRLYCTATHVDLVFEASGVSFAARRSGLDASPGWVRDLMRVVAFHFE